jgi:hypothetical protein
MRDPPKQPADQLLPSPFSFSLRRWQVGPGCQGHPLPSAAGQPRPWWPPAVTGGSPALPRLQMPSSSGSEADLHSPPINWQFSPLNPSPSWLQSRPQVIDGHGRRGAALPPLPGLYKHGQGTCRTPFAYNRAPTPPLLCTCTATDWSSSRHAISAARAFGEASLTLSSCFYFTPEAYSCIDFGSQGLFYPIRALPPSSSTAVRRRRSLSLPPPHRPTPPPTLLSVVSKFSPTSFLFFSSSV